MSWQETMPLPPMIDRDPQTRTWAQQITGNAIVKSVTTTHSAESTDSSILCDATAAGFTVTLPDATTCKGARLRIKKIDASANAVTVDGKGAQTLEGATTIVLVAQWDSAEIQSDGSNWVVWSILWHP
jgi:hypothetical protein